MDLEACGDGDDEEMFVFNDDRVSSGGCVGRCEVFFFFQAEDGIRDVAVTGVQTCALPILGSQDMERRHFLGGALFTVAASVAPSLAWLLDTLAEATTARGRIDSSQVAAIRDRKSVV